MGGGELAELNDAERERGREGKQATRPAAPATCRFYMGWNVVKVYERSDGAVDDTAASRDIVTHMYMYIYKDNWITSGEIRLPCFCAILMTI